MRTIADALEERPNHAPAAIPSAEMLRIRYPLPRLAPELAETMQDPGAKTHCRGRKQPRDQPPVNHGLGCAIAQS